MSQNRFVPKVRPIPRGATKRILSKSETTDGDERYRAMVDSSRHWEYLVEANGRLGYVSPACEAISGYAPEEFEQNPRLLETIIHAEDRAEVGHHFPESANSADESSLEFRIITKSGEVRWIEHHCQTIRTQGTRYVARRATNQDITTRKQIELEQTRAEKRLKQLTHQLITIQEVERRRIAQDLHDDTGQGMTALLLRLNAIHTGFAPEQEELKRQLQEAIQIVEALMNQIRQLAYQLRPPSLDSVPLSKALESLCASFRQNGGPRIDYSSDTELPPIPNLQAIALYRLVQEGLTNIVKYAEASAAWVNLDYVDGEVSLSIEDNGQGFDSKKAGEGMGLLGLQERFQLLNGSLEVESAPSVGTRLYGFLPLADHSL